MSDLYIAWLPEKRLEGHRCIKVGRSASVPHRLETLRRENDERHELLCQLEGRGYHESIVLAALANSDFSLYRGKECFWIPEAMIDELRNETRITNILRTIQRPR